MLSLSAAPGPARYLGASLALMANASSEGQSATSSTAINEQVQRASLLTPDEIERHFCREEQSQIVLIKGKRPMALLREAYHDSEALASQL